MLTRVREALYLAASAREWLNVDETALADAELLECEGLLAAVVADLEHERARERREIVARLRELRAELGGGPEGAPGFIIMLGLEGAPVVLIDADGDLDRRRLDGWLARHPALAAVVAGARAIRRAA